MGLPQARRFFSLAIVPASRDDSQTWTVSRNLQRVVRVLRERHIFGVISEQILRAQGPKNVTESHVQCGSEIGGEYHSAGAVGESGQCVFTADVAAGIVLDWHHEDRIDHSVCALCSIVRGMKIIVAERGASI